MGFQLETFWVSRSENTTEYHGFPELETLHGSIGLQGWKHAVSLKYLKEGNVEIS